MNFLKFASIPLALFVVFFGIPKLVAMLINMHNDFGLIALVTLFCGIVGFIGSRLYNASIEKENVNED